MLFFVVFTIIFHGRDDIILSLQDVSAFYISHLFFLSIFVFLFA